MLAQRFGPEILALWALRQLPPQLVTDLWTMARYQREASLVDQE